MWEVFTDLTANIGMSFVNTVLLLVLVGGIIFYAKGFQLGIMLHFLATGLSLMWFIKEGLPISTAAGIFFTLFVIMALSLYFIKGDAQESSLV